MLCRGALGYVAFPARSGKYLPAGRTGRWACWGPGGGTGLRGSEPLGPGVLSRSGHGGTEPGVDGARGGPGRRWGFPGRRPGGGDAGVTGVLTRSGSEEGRRGARAAVDGVGGAAVGAAHGHASGNQVAGAGAAKRPRRGEARAEGEGRGAGSRRVVQGVACGGGVAASPGPAPPRARPRRAFALRQTPVPVFGGSRYLGPGPRYSAAMGPRGRCGRQGPTHTSEPMGRGGALGPAAPADGRAAPPSTQGSVGPPSAPPPASGLRTPGRGPSVSRAPGKQAGALWAPRGQGHPQTPAPAPGLTPSPSPNPRPCPSLCPSPCP